LKKSIPRKIRAYSGQNISKRILIIHDQDSNDCKSLKRELLQLCRGSTNPVLIRIACRELENWYLGDMVAIEKVYPETKATKLANKQKYRNPDKIQGCLEMESLSKKFSKSDAARDMPKYMDLESNKSTSFNHFLTGLNKLILL
jgi:hypothetical protein